MSENNKSKTEWTVKELAVKAGVSEPRIRQELLSRRLRGRKIGPEMRGMWVIRDVDAQAWLESRE